MVLAVSKHKGSNAINKQHSERPEGKRVVAPPAVGPTVEIVDITPAMAAHLLEGNISNRTVSERQVAKYARDMASGAWRPYLNNVLVSSDGTIIDGGHRLTAIVVSGTTQRFIVVRGLPQSDQHFVDRNRKRSFADDLRIKGRKHYSTVASLTSAYLTYRHGSFVNRNWAPTEAQMHEYEASHQEELTRAVEKATHVRSLIGVAPTPSALAYFLFARIDSDLADAFFESLATGVGLDAGSPILALRNRIIRARDPQRRERLSHAESFAFHVLAWNAVREGRSVTRIQLPKGSVLTEKNLPRPA